MPPLAELAHLARIARRQLGVFTTADVMSSGLDRAFLSTMVGCGEWVGLHPAVWRAASTPVSLELRESAALLWLGEEAALSHLSAARRYGLGVPRSSAVWVTAPLSAKPRPQPNVIVTRSGVPFTPINVNGLVCVDSARAIADLAHCSDYAVTKSALLTAVQ
ncbi:MAG: hypothetical protein QOK42_2660, partial [Frankiaceae bacterium]|nr:hypothetical protein [Frankiaceae bacterium]